MERPYFLDEFIEDFGFWFEVIDHNPFPKPDTGWTKEFEEEEYDGTLGDPWASDYQPTWKREDEWDDEFKSLWQWAGNHRIYEGGEWEIAYDCLEEDWDADYLIHQYTYSPSPSYFFSNKSNTRFWDLLDWIENTNEEVFCRVATLEKTFDSFSIPELRDAIEEECWRINNIISYSTSLISNRKEEYCAYELKGIPAKRNQTVIIKQGKTAYFVGHKRRIEDSYTEEAEVLRGEIRDGQVIPERPREEFAVESTSPSRIYDIAEDIFASHEIDYMEANN